MGAPPQLETGPTPLKGTWDQRLGYPPEGHGRVIGSIMGWRLVTTPGGGQTENITFRHPSDAGGKNTPAWKVTEPRNFKIYDFSDNVFN